MKELYIIRHGETELNRQGIVQGRGINSDLNETGKLQAKAFFKHYQSVNFDRIYTSKLKRTHQTVQSFIDLGLPWQQLEGLDELAWGIWEGKPNTEDARAAFKEIAEKWQGGNYEAKFESGESPNEVAVRLKQALDIIKSLDGERILICMHGRAMRLFLCVLLEKPLCEMAEFPHQNTTLYRLKLDDKGHAAVIDFNNTNHLKDLIDPREKD